MARPSLLALPLLLAAAPAPALTPEELWSAWQAQAAGWGVTLSAEAVPEAGGAILLRNWARTLPGGAPEPLPADSPIREVRLTPTADGGVAIELVGLPESGTIPGAADAMGDLYLRERGLSITARDGTDAVEYEIAADSVQMATVAPAGDPDPGNYAVEAQGLRFRFPGEVGADRQVTLSLSMSGVAYVANTGDAATYTAASQSSRTTGEFGFTATVAVPEGIDWGNLDGAELVGVLDRGLAVRLDLQTGDTTQEGRFEGFPFAYSYESAGGPGRAGMVVDRSQVAIDGRFEGGSLTLHLPDMGVPVLDVTYGPMEGEFRVPLTAEPGELRYRLSLGDVTVGEAAWAMLDPQGLLPRDPIRLVVDAGGRMGFDLPAMMAAEAAGQPAPDPRVESLELAAFEFAGAGLRVTASGSLAFPGGDPEAQPTGTGTVRVEGVDRLIDALVAAGVVTESDASNARLGLATVFRPGGAPDTREATFELRADGSVWANGVQVP